MRVLIVRVANPAFLLIALMTLTLLPAIFGGHIGQGGLASDAITYHLPQIEQFRQNPFNFFRYYATATTLPFYHVFMGWIAILTGNGQVDNNDIIMRIIHLVFSFIGIFFLFLKVFQRCSISVATLMCLPLASSFYVLSGALYFGTDGPGFSLLLLSLIAMSSPIYRPFVIALVALGVAAIRHLYFPGTLGAVFGGIVGSTSSRVKLSLLAGLIPSVLILGVYFTYWGGARPANELIKDLNPQGLFLYSILAHFGIVGLWGVAFGMLIWEDLLSTWRDAKTWVFAFAITIALASLWYFTPTSASVPDGRFGSIIWRLSDFALIGNRSVVVLIAAVVGGIILSMYITKLLNDNAPLVALGGLIATVMSLGLTYAAYQRYSEPAVLGCFILMNLDIHQREPIGIYKFFPIIMLSMIGFYTFITKVYI